MKNVSNRPSLGSKHTLNTQQHLSAQQQEAAPTQHTGLDVSSHPVLPLSELLLSKKPGTLAPFYYLQKVGAISRL